MPRPKTEIVYDRLDVIDKFATAVKVALEREQSICDLKGNQASIQGDTAEVLCQKSTALGYLKAVSIVNGIHEELLRDALNVQKEK